MCVFIGVLVAILAGFTALNIIARKQAYSMLHFRGTGELTSAPEELTCRDKIKTLLFGVSIVRPSNDKTPADYDLSFEVHNFKAADGVNLEAWYIAADNAKGTVLLFHGYKVCKSAMLRPAKEFFDMGYSVFIIDFRGGGGSDLDYSSIGFHEAKDVAAAVEYAARLEPENSITLFGQSMGGAAALKAIAAHDVKPDYLILEAVFNHMLDTVKNRFRSMGLPTFPAAHLLTYWGGRLMGFSAFRHNPVDYAASVTCPTLILNGTDDPRATIYDARELYDSLDVPKDFVQFHGVGHEPCLDEDPELWRTTMKDFFSRHPQKNG